MWGYIIGISGLFFTILGVLATIFGWRLRRKVKRETETQISKSQLQESGVEKEQETQIPPQPTMTDEAGKLGVPRLMEILKDLGSYSTRLSFIKTNIDLMPASLSLDELHRILALFGSYDYKLTVIQIFLPRLPDSLSLSELNRMLALFGSYDYKLTVTRIFLSRLRADYSESDFNTYKRHYGSISYKQQAIELLLRKNQKQ